MKHDFTQNILEILINNFGVHSKYIYKQSELLQYINQKTVSAHRGSKARGSFGNLYAIYVLVEDYINQGFDENGDYSKCKISQNCKKCDHNVSTNPLHIICDLD